MTWLNKILSPYINTIIVSIISILIVIALGLYWENSSLTIKLDIANGKLAVINNTSEEIKIKTVEIEKKIPVIQWRVKQNLQTITEYKYDENKSECCNALDSMRNTFTGLRDENGVLEVSGDETNTTTK